ncbi:MAG: hypothetical protein DRO90_01665 [Candidatus Altiarchaeales archaeon]|nr:MAG: hypothetical protein DRO95_01060 [Candidatus Altiarchaeales archaeon]RLI94667.1 MAG: hypothetical protein DRO90_01665 [Candidatus Altiarchaeales archaeon]RLI94793.1 MAG: hypothetical protein DRO94_02095 [Candidatus Altiarchaeales archaeon]HDO82210.1 GNAT family N-acetyltransferase [Candidatus Altiarchaeales archaeon]HEX54859.1 GNAT family N-acetyltransferase [Candidatus Altiarchaeales archaeon]
MFNLKNLNIREFEPWDAEPIVEMHNESRESFEEENITREFILEVSKRRDFRFFVSAFGRKIVGFMGILFHENVGRAEIGPICVRADYRGLGIGSNLLEHGTNFLRKRNIHRVIVRVKSNNINAIRFFSKNGFRVEGYFEKYTRKGEDVIQMVRFI